VKLPSPVYSALGRDRGRQTLKLAWYKAGIPLGLKAAIAFGYPEGRASRLDRDPLEEKVF
jgi:hypothetical protein